jgi:hypothetical protein
MRFIPSKDYDSIAFALLIIFTYTRSIVPFLKAVIGEEIKTTCKLGSFPPNLSLVSASTLFRSNNISSKLLTIYALEVGRDFIHNTLQPPLNKYLGANKSLEIDPQRVIGN